MGSTFSMIKCFLRIGIETTALKNVSKLTQNQWLTV